MVMNKAAALVRIEGTVPDGGDFPSKLSLVNTGSLSCVSGTNPTQKVYILIHVTHMRTCTHILMFPVKTLNHIPRYLFHPYKIL